MKLTYFFAIFVISTAATATPPPLSKDEKPQIPHTAEWAVVTNANGKFAIDLYQQIANEHSKENIFFSPLSVSTALAMATEGAVDETLKQMVKVLHLPAGDLAEFHRNQSALLKHSLPTAVPPAVKAKIVELQTKLDLANKNTQEIQRASNSKGLHDSMANAQIFADELNTLRKQSQSYELTIANTLWAEKTHTLPPSFLNALQTNYGAVLFSVDFKTNPEPTRLHINRYLEQLTNNRVRDFIGPRTIDQFTRMVITNAIYFRGEWAEPFKKGATSAGSFQLANGQSVELPMMHQINSLTAAYAAFDGDGNFFTTPHEIPFEAKDDDDSFYPDARGFTMLSLDYRGGNRLMMVVAVPQSVDGLPAIEKRLKHDALQNSLGRLAKRKVNITLPKFSLETNYDISETLKSMGMVRAFDGSGGPGMAQFDKMSSNPKPEDRLFISKVLHKTFVDVNEVGTEAAAVTTIIFPTASARPDVPKTRPFVPIFKADKPFLFFIRDRETSSILFMGRYSAPTVIP